MKYLILFGIIASSSFNIYINSNNERIVDDVLFCQGEDCSHHCENLGENNIATESEINGLGPADPIDPNPPSILNLDNSFVYAKEFTKNYFMNLKEYMFSNVIYSENGNTLFTLAKCPFTAIGMLLSFYDIYWNNNIIPNIYQTSSFVPNLNDYLTSYESPGILDSWQIYYTTEDNQEISDQNILNSIVWDFIYEAENLVDSSYLAYLINLARINNIFSETGQTAFGLVDSKIHEFYEAIVEDNPVLSSYFTLNRMSESNGYTKSQIWSKTIELVNAGIPVAALTYQNNGGHIYIAYDYADGELFGNLGYKHHHTYDSLNTTYGEGNISTIYYFDVSTELDHVHNQFYVQNLIGSGSCSCKLASHQHSYDYETFDSEHHKKKCRCQFAASLHDHVFSRVEIINYNYYAICKFCNFSKLVNEDFVPMI